MKIITMTVLFPSGWRNFHFHIPSDRGVNSKPEDRSPEIRPGPTIPIPRMQHLNALPVRRDNLRPPELLPRPQPLDEFLRNTRKTRGGFALTWIAITISPQSWGILVISHF